MTPEDINRYYLNAEGGPGGWYPIGASQMWHNGVHLIQSRTEAVRAVAHGRIVAARFARNDELDEFPFGSPGFVLVKHNADTFPSVPIQQGEKPPSSLRQVMTEIPYVLEPGKPKKGHLGVGSIVEVVENSASEAQDSSSDGTMTFSSKDLSQKVQVPDLDEEKPVWIRDHQARRKMDPVAASTTTMEVAVADEEGGIKCRSRTDFDDNDLGVIPKGAKVKVYDQKTRAHGEVWQAVRAPDQDIPFGWIVTSGDRVRPVNGEWETTDEFYSLYMNVAWEPLERTQTTIPWMLPYYQHIFDQKPELPRWEEMAILTEKTGYRQEINQKSTDSEDESDLSTNLLVKPTGRRATIEGEEWSQIRKGTDLVWVPNRTLGDFDSKADVGRIVTDEDEGGVRVRSYTKFDEGNVLGILPKGDQVLMSKAIESNQNDWKWKRVYSLEQQWGGWVAAEKSGEEANVAVPDEFKNTAENLKKGECVKMNIPVSASEPLANVGLLHPKGYVENLEEDQYGVHLEIFSEKHFFGKAHMKNGGWVLVEDDSGTNVISRFSTKVIDSVKAYEQREEAKAPEQVTNTAQDIGAKKVEEIVQSALKHLGWNESSAQDAEEVRNTRESMSDRLPTLRKLITRNTSYWAKDWKKVKNKNKKWAEEFTLSDDDAKNANKYMWWEKCKDLDVPLPDDPLLYHYHPITFLDYLNSQLETEEADGPDSGAADSSTDARVGAGDGGTEEKRIDRVWLWHYRSLKGKPSLSSRKKTRKFVSDCKKINITDIVYSLNKLLDLENKGYNTKEEEFYEGGKKYEIIKNLEFYCKPEIDLHFMIFVEPEESLIKKWASVVRKLTSIFDIRSVQLDAEGWWYKKGENQCKKGAKWVDKYFVEWLSIPVGVTGIPVCPKNTKPLLNVVDYAVPQMYADEDFGSSKDEMKKRTEKWFERYDRALRPQTMSEALGPPKRIVVGMTSNEEKLGPQPAPKRMSMMLDTVLQLGGLVRPPVREVAFWSSAPDQLSGDRKEFINRIAALAKQGELTRDFTDDEEIKRIVNQESKDKESKESTPVTD